MPWPACFRLLSSNGRTSARQSTPTTEACFVFDVKNVLVLHGSVPARLTGGRVCLLACQREADHQGDVSPIGGT